MRCFNLFISTLLISASVPALAHAEIGSSTGVGGIYISFEGGYHQSNASSVAAQGDSVVIPGTVSDVDSAGSASAKGQRSLWSGLGQDQVRARVPQPVQVRRFLHRAAGAAEQSRPWQFPTGAILSMPTMAGMAA